MCMRERDSEKQEEEETETTGKKEKVGEKACCLCADWCALELAYFNRHIYACIHSLSEQMREGRLEVLPILGNKYQSIH